MDENETDSPNTFKKEQPNPMPELPEVETMVRDLRSRVTGRTIESVEVSWDRLVGHPSRPEFERGVRSQRIESLTRRGKFAIFSLDRGDQLAMHRGMTGSLLLRRVDAPEDRFVRARFRLDDATEIRFDDSRKFGRLFWMAQDNEHWTPPWANLGLEPLSVEFETSAFQRRLAKRKAAVKTVLLNQKVVAGIGNIYADESLFAAGIDPRRPANSLTEQEIERLRRAVVSVLSAAISARGTTFSTYRDINGSEGTHQQRLMVFHRHDELCASCGSTIERIVLGARGTHFCPHCQS